MGESMLISSGKGGVGKTTAAINLGVALGMLGKDVTIVDANLPTPNVALHLKIPPDAKTLNDVVRGKATLSDAAYLLKNHTRVIPASFSVESLQGFDPKKFKVLIKKIEADNDITLIDCAPGLGIEVINALKASEQMILITNPEVPAVADAGKAIQIAKDLGVKITGVIVNRTGRFKQELSSGEIASVLGGIKIIGCVPEDALVTSATSFGEPVVSRYPFSPAAKAFKRIAAGMAGEKFEERLSIIDRIKAFLARRG